MLRYAILSLICETERSGYELGQAFGRTVGYFWNAQLSQIYPELHRLESEGLVSVRNVAQQDKPDKKLYLATEVGVATLTEWIQTPVERSPMRDPMLVRAVNLGRMPLDSARRLLDSRRAHHEERIAHYREIREGVADIGISPGDPLNVNSGWMLALEAGIRVEQAYADWCGWAIAQLEESWRKRGEGSKSESSSRK